MAGFDPYHKWLGIPAAEQPPTHYRLLGISPTETDPDVIDAAANRQMSYVQGFAAGPHAAESQKLLNELSAARLCLLNPSRRQAYDAALLGLSKPTPPAPTPTPTPARPRRRVEKPLPPPPPPLKAEILPAPIAPTRREDWLPATVEPPIHAVPMPRRDWTGESRNAWSPRRVATIAGIGLALFVVGFFVDRAIRREDAPPAPAEPPPVAAVADAAETAPVAPTFPADAAEFQGSHYKVFWERLSWPEAEEKCRLAGGRLACPEMTDAQNFLAKLKGDGKVVWVGGYRDSSGLWYWVNGRRLESHRIGGVEEGYNHVAFTVNDDLNCRTTSGHAPGYASEWVEGYICEWTGESKPTEPFDLAASEPVGEVRRFTGHETYVTSAAFSPDGQRVVTGSNDKTVRVWSAATGREIWKSTAPGEMVRAVAFAPDGRTVYECDLAGYRVLNAETGELERSVNVAVWDRGVFSADCSKLLARHPGGTLTVYNTADGSVQHRVAESNNNPGIAFSADGGRIYYAKNELTELNLDTKRVRTLGSRQNSYFETMAASQNGDRLVWGSGRFWDGRRDVPGDHMVRVWDIRGERLVAELRGHDGWLWAVAISADGRRVLSGGGGRPDDWYAHNPGADTSIRLWDVDARKPIRNFDGHKNAILSLAFSPDGKYALSGSADSTARLWRLPDAGAGEDRPTTAARAEPFPIGRYRLEVFDETLNTADSPLTATFFKDHDFQATGVSTITEGTWEIDHGRLLVKTRRFGEVVFDVSLDQTRLTAKIVDPETRRRKRLTMSSVE